MPIDKLPGFKEMGMNPFTLKFKDTDKNDEFMDDYHQKSILQVRISFFLAVLLFGIFGILDSFFMNDMTLIVWLIRFSVIIPIGFLILVTSFAPEFKRFRDATLAFSMFLFGIGVIFMIIVSPKPVDFSYYASLIIVFIFIYTFISIRFVWAAISGLSILIIYEIVALFVIKTPASTLIKINFFFLSTNLIGLCVAYTIEFFSKRDFYILKLIQKRQEDLAALNDVLEEKVNKRASQLEKIYNETVLSFTTAIELRDPYTVGHQQSVMEIALEIAEEMDLSEAQRKAIRIASLVHDIGKISVPTDILNKPGMLNTSEHNIIRKHPVSGYEILKNISFNEPIPEIVLQHHEKCDGSGYPNGLEKEDILLEARIIQVADVIDAITNSRPYRQALGFKKALNELKENKGILYDPEVVEAFMRVVEEKNYRVVRH